MPAARPRASAVRVAALYVGALVVEFRGTLLTALAAVALGAAAFLATPLATLGGRTPSLHQAAFAAWMALFGQIVHNPPDTVLLEVLHAVYPVVGFVVLGEGLVRFALLMTSRRRGERAWIRVMASTHRDHVVVCGVGHLGLRVVEELCRRGDAVVVVERDPTARFLPAVRALGVPALVADMRDDSVLRDAGVERARAVVVATNDDMGNLEVALDARRMNPKVQVLVRFYDQAIAAKIRAAFGFDDAFSSAALAAPTIADRVRPAAAG
ncbi:MAG: NAD-binding protein [Planctomycetes bacterium]|nr:NAD-binding protein [Planctomycetota bacterium]